MCTCGHSSVLRLAIAACTLALVAGCGAGNASRSSSTDGAALVNELCGRCHPLERVADAKKDRAGWSAAVDRMVSHGLNVDATQKATIVDYLTKRDSGS